MIKVHRYVNAIWDNFTMSDLLDWTKQHKELVNGRLLYITRNEVEDVVLVPFGDLLDLTSGIVLSYTHDEQEEPSPGRVLEALRCSLRENEFWDARRCNDG